MAPILYEMVPYNKNRAHFTYIIIILGVFYKHIFAYNPNFEINPLFVVNTPAKGKCIFLLIAYIFIFIFSIVAYKIVQNDLMLAYWLSNLMLTLKCLVKHVT